MGRLKNIGSTFSRYQTSKGFGVHSPFAFSFILNVLDEKYGYYSYDSLQLLRTTVTSRTRYEQGYKPRVIPLSEAAAMFRVANYYNPSVFLSIGGSYGVAVASLLMVSRRSRVVLYDTAIKENVTAQEILANYGSRISDTATLQGAIDSYDSIAGEENRFVVINNIADSDVDVANRLVDNLVKQQGVLVLRNIGTSRVAAALWKRCKEGMKYGMTFSNGKMAFVILNPKLPRQDFSIWL